MWLLVVIAVAVMKYGKIKLGKENEEPEFSDATYFAISELV